MARFNPCEDNGHAAFADLGDDGVLSDRRVGGNGFAHAFGSMLHWFIESISHFGGSNFFTNA